MCNYQYYFIVLILISSWLQRGTCDNDQLNCYRITTFYREFDSIQFTSLCCPLLVVMAFVAGCGSSSCAPCSPSRWCDLMWSMPFCCHLMWAMPFCPPSHVSHAILPAISCEPCHMIRRNVWFCVFICLILPVISCIDSPNYILNGLHCFCFCTGQLFNFFFHFFFSSRTKRAECVKRPFDIRLSCCHGGLSCCYALFVVFSTLSSEVDTSLLLSTFSSTFMVMHLLHISDYICLLSCRQRSHHS